MVLSTTTRTASISSIVNQDQGGGERKAGLPYQVGRDTWTSIILHPHLRTVDYLNDKTKIVTIRRYIRNVGMDMRIPGR
jgi:hypothetical protein